MEIKAHFDGKEVGDCDSWKRMMEEVPFHVYTMKEPDYIMLLTSTYGTNRRVGKETSHEWVDSSGMKKMGIFISLRLWGIISYTDTLSIITTINDTHLLAWKFFGQQNIGQTMCFLSSWV